MYWTRNTRGEYAIVKLEEFEKLQATIELLANIEKGAKSAGEEKLYTLDKMNARVGL